MKKLITIVIFLTFILTLAGCNTNNDTSTIPTADGKCRGSEYGAHSWSSPSCVEPAKCYHCGVYKDETLSDHHNWYNNGDNLTKCFDCDILREDWLQQQGLEQQNDTTDNTDNEVLEGIIDETDDYQVSNNVVETKTESTITFIMDDHFIISPAAFADRLEDSSSRLKNIDYCTVSEYNDEYAFFDEDNSIFYRIQDKNDDYEDIGMISFIKTDGKTVAVMDQYTENCIGHINILVEDSYDVSAVVYSSVLAIDPNIGYDEAAEVGQTIVDNLAIIVGDIDEKDFQGINYNGITYLLFKDREFHYLTISVTSSI